MDELRALYQETFSPLGPSETTKAKVARMRPSAPRRYVRRLSGLMAAVIAVLALLGCAAAAAWGSGIQGWFTRYWEAVHDSPMSQGQQAVIDHLTQELNLSQTVDGVTVTVDSATVGDDTFFLLLRVEGQKFSRRKGYDFDHVGMEFSPDPTGGGGLSGYGQEYHGLDEKGAVLFLLDMGYAPADGFVQDTSPLSVELTLTDLTQTGGAGQRKLLAEGTWSFSFELDRSVIEPPVKLEDTSVLLYNPEAEGYLSAPVSRIEVTCTGVRFRIRDTQGRTAELMPRLFLKDGTMVNHSGGFGSAAEDEESMVFSYRWSVPVDLSEAAALQLGETKLPLP